MTSILFLEASKRPATLLFATPSFLPIDDPAMDNIQLLDELRRLEREVVAGERRLAELEASVADMKREKLDAEKAVAELHALRESQRLRQQDRLRVLSLLQR